MTTDDQPEEEEIPVEEETSEPKPEVETVTTAYGDVQSEGTAELQIIARVRHHIEDGQNRIERENRKQSEERTAIELLSDNRMTWQRVTMELERRVLERDMIIMALGGTLEGVRQNIDTLQRSIRER